MEKKLSFFYKLVDKFYIGLGYGFKWLFYIFSSKKISRNKELSDINLVIFCGKYGATLLKPTLLSIYHRWSKIPAITIVSDGTSEDYLAKHMQFWPFPYVIKSWEEAANFHRKRNRMHLLEFGSNCIMGRKIMAILAEAEVKPILYCDTDVLWFAEPNLPEVKPLNSFTMRMATDNLHCYILPMLKALNKEDLLTRPPLNSGVIFMSGSVYDHSKEFEKVERYLSMSGDPYAEQTALAIIADELGDRWTLNDIILSTKDKFWPIFPEYFFTNQYHFARHHVVTKKSWFWRDALYIILFKRRQAKNTKSNALALNKTPE